MRSLCKKISCMILLVFFVMTITSCGSDKTLKIINVDTNESITVTVKSIGGIRKDDLPTKIGNYYVKWYALDKNGTRVIKNSKVELKNNTIYYKQGIKKDYFDIDVVGTILIDAKEEIVSKEDYVDAKISVYGGDYEIIEDAQIRLRGNTTFHLPKKPYKIKFKTKQDLYGMGADKEWALLANYYDPSHMRNYYAYRFAKALGLEFSIDAKYVEVYLNGEYNGLYLLTETVKTSKGRVDIEVNDYSAGVPFLLELDMKLVDDNPNYKENIDKDMFILDNSKYNKKKYPFGTKYPKTFNELSSDEYKYIKEYISNTFESVRNGTYQEYIDVDSFINYFLVQEIFMNVDLDYSSVYLYKSVDSKLKFGPIWDFDLSSGNVGYVKKYSFDKMMKDVNGGNYLFTTAMGYPEFYDLVLQRFLEINCDIIPAMLDSIDTNYAILSSYAERDNEKWGVFDEYSWARPEHLVGISYEEQVEYFKNFITAHNDWMIDNL